jgi:hypothetical protein
MLTTNDIYIEEISHLQNKNFKPVSQNRKNAQANSSNSDDLLVRDMPVTTVVTALLAKCKAAKK